MIGIHRQFLFVIGPHFRPHICLAPSGEACFFFSFLFNSGIPSISLLLDKSPESGLQWIISTGYRPHKSKPQPRIARRLHQSNLPWLVFQLINTSKAVGGSRDSLVRRSLFIVAWFMCISTIGAEKVRKIAHLS